MASSFPLLEQDLSCPVCFEIFREPVLLSCGHSLCQGCVNSLWSGTRRSERCCPVCRKHSARKPPINFSLRNTCESYLLGRDCGGVETAKVDAEEKSGVMCLVHWQKFSHFCELDEELLCFQCWQQSRHLLHRVSPIQEAAGKYKDNLRDALNPVEKKLQSLQDGSAMDTQLIRHIKYQGHHTEKQIKDEFQKLHQFLRDEEDARINALKEEEEQKREKVEERVKDEMLALSNRVSEVKEAMETDDIKFIQSYNFTKERAKYMQNDPELNSGALIDISKHLGNLRYRVWQKMKDISPYYPIILDPNQTHPDFTVADDLSSITWSPQVGASINPLRSHGDLLALASEGYADGLQAWEIEVGDSCGWTLGVTEVIASRTPWVLLSPGTGFWAIRRSGDTFEALTCPVTQLEVHREPSVVLIKLGWGIAYNEQGQLSRQRKVTFCDGMDGSCICTLNAISSRAALHPFLIPGERGTALRIRPSSISTEVESKLSFMERHEGRLPLYGICLVVLICIVFVSLFGGNKGS